MKNYMNLQPLGTNILVHRPKPKLLTGGGIHLPENSQERPPEAVVVRLGLGKKNDEDWKGFEVSETERVLTERFGGTDLGDGFQLLPESAILGVLTEDEAGMTQLFPVAHNLVVAMLPPEEKVGTIVLPEFSKEVQEFGVVMAGADACELEDGAYVFVSRSQGTHYRANGKDYLIVDERKVKAIVKKD